MKSFLVLTACAALTIAMMPTRMAGGSLAHAPAKMYSSGPRAGAGSGSREGAADKLADTFWAPFPEVFTGDGVKSVSERFAKPL